MKKFKIKVTEFYDIPGEDYIELGLFCHIVSDLICTYKRVWGVDCLKANIGDLIRLLLSPVCLLLNPIITYTNFRYIEDSVKDRNRYEDTYVKDVVVYFKDCSHLGSRSRWNYGEGN